MAKASSLHKLQHPTGRTAGRQALFNILIGAAVLGIFGTQLGSLSESIAVLRTADWLLLSLAVLLLILSYVVAAQTYRTLADKPVRLSQIMCIQVASGVVNRLLPIGIGSLGLYVAFFHKRGMTVAAAAALVGTNNILGVFSTILLITAVVASHPSYIAALSSPKVSLALLVALLVGSVIVALVFMFGRPDWKLRAQTATAAILHALRNDLHPSKRTAYGLIYNAVLTILLTTILTLSARAVGGTLDWTAALLVLSIGMLVGSAVPTPGGIGGVEAGLLAGMLTFGVSPVAGLAAVFLFRGLTYWLPIVPGICMFRYAQKHLL